MGFVWLPGVFVCACVHTSLRACENVCWCACFIGSCDTAEGALDKVMVVATTDNVCPLGLLSQDSNKPTSTHTRTHTHSAGGWPAISIEKTLDYIISLPVNIPAVEGETAL